MKNQGVDSLPITETASITDLESLAQGYILSCRCEGKSPKTVAIYETVIRNFLWFCRENGYPREPQKINATHIRELLWYLASETNRWGDNNPATRKPASRTTVNGYYRALRTFFNWLEHEQIISDNPFKFLKTPKPDMTIVQALTPTVTVLISKVILGNINAVSRSN